MMLQRAHSGRSGAALFYGRYLGDKNSHTSMPELFAVGDKLQRCARSEPSGKQLSSGEVLYLQKEGKILSKSNGCLEKRTGCIK